MDEVTTHRTHWINGKPWTGTAAITGDIYNPATGKVSGTVDYAGAAEVDAAVAAATAALPGWRETSLVKRAGVMFAFRELVRQRQSELAAAITAVCPWLAEICPSLSPADGVGVGAGVGEPPVGLEPPPPHALMVMGTPPKTRRAAARVNSRRSNRGPSFWFFMCASEGSTAYLFTG